MKNFQIIPTDTKFDFIGKFKYFLAFSIISLCFVVVGIFTKGLWYGIDFTGGIVMQVKFSEGRKAEDVRKLMAELGAEDASVVALGTSNQEYLITSREVHDQKKELGLNLKLVAKLGADKVAIQSVDIVGPKVGAELKMAALRSLFYSVILITIYIWLRFDFRFAPGATVAMIHDIAMTTGFYLLTGREFTITAIAALLTIAGYSVNDTIVVYDRVREMFKRGGATLPLPETINKAINITLSRTLLTSGVTLISILPIIVFCSGEIQSFAIAMCFGIFVGTYSTVYIASPLTIYVEKFQNRKKNAGAPGRPAPATR